MIDKNTVILDVYEYNRLRDFEKEINAGNAYWCFSSYDGNYKLLTVNEAIKKLAEDNKDLKELNNELREVKKKEHTVEEIKRMSFWKLLKWYFKK